MNGLHACSAPDLRSNEYALMNIDSFAKTWEQMFINYKVHFLNIESAPNC